MVEGDVHYWAGGHFVVIDLRGIEKISNRQEPYLLKVPISDKANESVPHIVKAHQYLSTRVQSVLPANQINCIAMPMAKGELVLNIQDKKKKEYAMELAKVEKSKIEKLGFTNLDSESAENLFFDGKQVYLIDLSTIQLK
jgi:hypothetical protein